jgi:hypothetical protein
MGSSWFSTCLLLKNVSKLSPFPVASKPLRHHYFYYPGEILIDYRVKGDFDTAVIR